LHGKEDAKKTSSFFFSLKPLRMKNQSCLLDGFQFREHGMDATPKELGKHTLEEYVIMFSGRLHMSHFPSDGPPIWSLEGILLHSCEVNLHSNIHFPKHF
jgi:hypothetical protein